MERAIALDPANPCGHKRVTLAYLNYFGAFAGMNTQLSEEQSCRAETACRAAISLDPSDAEAFLMLGQIINIEIRGGYREDDAAIESIKKSIELKPDWADAYCTLGHAYNLLKRYEECAAAYAAEAALRDQQGFLSTADAATLDSRRSHEVSDDFVVADIYTNLGKHREALKPLQHAEKLQPEDDFIHFLVGKAYLRIGDVDSARCEQALVAGLCASKKFLEFRCEAYAKELMADIESTQERGPF
jgi:predicted Zn-dependent protease